MSDAYLEEMDRVLRASWGGCRDLHEVAEKTGLPFEVVCNTFNNGLLKGWWRIALARNQLEMAIRSFTNLGDDEVHTVTTPMPPQ
jgi:hypothetical protein